MKKRLIMMFAAVFALTMMLSACGGNDKPAESTDKTNTAATNTEKEPAAEPVKIEFFQTKNETAAKATYDSLIAKFQAANPNITVEQVNPANAETVLKTRVATGDVPDVIAMAPSDTYKTLTESDVLENLKDDPKVALVQESYLQMVVKQQPGNADKVFGIPYSSNANGVLYNKKEFAELGISIPKTWDEFVAAAQKIKDAGKTPFFMTFKDSWTTLPLFNALASNLPGDTFFADRTAGTATFADKYREVAEKQLQLTELANPDRAGKGYSDGNVAFAKGQSVMYLQGVWAIPEIVKANPDIELGSFPYPVSNDAAKNRLVSGVDVLLAITKKSENKEAAQKFVEFLLQPENAKQFIDEQKAFSAVKGVSQTDPKLAELDVAFQSGQLVGFADHSIPAAMKLDTLVQEFVVKKDIDAFLKKLDTEWDKVAGRK